MSILFAAAVFALLLVGCKQTCGANSVVVGGCASRCPDPCVCATVLSGNDGEDPYELCATPCTIPGSCSGSEKCALLHGAQQPVCLPETLHTPTGDHGGMLDCFEPGAMSCRNGYLVQSQAFFTLGGLSGSYCADVLLENCTEGCSRSDSGPPNCRGIRDAGPAEAGAPCCPANEWYCHSLGGPKRPPHGCRVDCCYACGWQATTIDNCAGWIPVKHDAGVSKDSRLGQ